MSSFVPIHSANGIYVVAESEDMRMANAGCRESTWLRGGGTRNVQTIGRYCRP